MYHPRWLLVWLLICQTTQCVMYQTLFTSHSSLYFSISLSPSRNQWCSLQYFLVLVFFKYYFYSSIWNKSESIRLNRLTNFSNKLQLFILIYNCGIVSVWVADRHITREESDVNWFRICDIPYDLQTNFTRQIFTL